MAAVQPIRKQSYEQIYLLLKNAILQKHCLSAFYKSHFRLFCPCILGRSRDQAVRILAYQYGGESRSGLRPAGSPENWRCIAIEKLTEVKLVDDEWIATPNHSRPQSCIVTVEFDANLPDLLAKHAME